MMSCYISATCQSVSLDGQLGDMPAHNLLWMKYAIVLVPHHYSFLPCDACILSTYFVFVVDYLNLTCSMPLMMILAEELYLVTIN